MYREGLQEYTRPTNDPIKLRAMFMHNAEQLVGLEAGDNYRATRLEILGTCPVNGQWDIDQPFLIWTDVNGASHTEGISMSGLVAEGIWRRMGVDLQELYDPYVPFTTIKRSRSFARDIGAWVVSTWARRPRYGDYVIVGSGASTHVLTCTGWEGDILIGVEGGHVGEDNLQVVKECRRLWTLSPKPMLDGLEVEGWIDITRLRYRDTYCQVATGFNWCEGPVLNPVTIEPEDEHWTEAAWSTVKETIEDTFNEMADSVEDFAKDFPQFLEDPKGYLETKLAAVAEEYTRAQMTLGLESLVKGLGNEVGLSAEVQGVFAFVEKVADVYTGLLNLGHCLQFQNNTIFWTLTGGIYAARVAGAIDTKDLKTWEDILEVSGFFKAVGLNLEVVAPMFQCAIEAAFIAPTPKMIIETIAPPSEEAPSPGTSSTGMPSGGTSNSVDLDRSTRETRVPGSLQIQSKLSGKCLDVDTNLGNGGIDNGVNVQQWEWLDGNNQRWILTQLEDGSYRILSRHSGKCLDIDLNLGNGGNDNGVNVQQWEWLGGYNQRWLLTKLEDGSYQIRSKHSGKCLDVEGWGADNGVNIQQWEWHGGDNQRWWIIVQKPPKVERPPMIQREGHDPNNKPVIRMPSTAWMLKTKKSKTK